jgi:hypothetical protein
MLLETTFVSRSGVIGRLCVVQWGLLLCSAAYCCWRSGSSAAGVAEPDALRLMLINKHPLQQ